MITPEQISRINELARKARQGELTPQEQAEQQTLRALYIQAFRQSMKSQLDAVVVVNPDGSRQALRRSPASPPDTQPDTQTD